MFPSVRICKIKRLEDIHSTDHRIHGKRECGIYVIRSFRADFGAAWMYHTGIGSQPAGVLSSVYTMCGGNCIH